MSRRGARKPKTADGRRDAASTPVRAKRGNGLWQAGNTAISRVIGQMEQGFGEDFSEVQVHTGPAVEETAAALGAVAFTRGDHVYLGKNPPAPDSAAGRRLLAHELSHVVQQRRAASVNVAAVGPAGDSFEQAADHAAARVVAGQPANVSTSGGTPGIQLQRVEGVNREKTEEAIKEFLKTAPRTPTGSIDISRIQTTFTKLALAPGPGEKTQRNGAFTRMRDVFNDKLLPRNPRDLAPKIAAALDYPMDPNALKAIQADPTHKPSTGQKLEDLFTKKKTEDPLGPLGKERQPGHIDPQEEMDRNSGTHMSPGLPIDKIPGVVPPAAKPTPQADPEDFPKKEADKPAEAKKEEEKPAAPPKTPAAPIQAPPTQTGLGVLPSVVDSAITTARKGGKSDADLILGNELLPQQQVVFGQVQHLLQVHSRDAGSRVTAVNVFMGGKLVKTVRLGAK